MDGVGGDAMWLVGVLVLAAVLVALTLLGVVASRMLRSDSRGSRVSPLDVLKDRYARGEIDQEELERRIDGLLRT